MHKRNLILFTVILLLSVVFGCDDSSTGPELASVQFSDFVHFDTSGYYLLKSNYGSGNSYAEVYLWWEENFGEPFTDLNDNGIYDPGFDLFYMCADCDSNQDLNHDGRWNGPDEPWEPGIPFDDIDGNGVCRQEDYYSDESDGSGMPYLDANGNDSWDDSLNYRCNFVMPVLVDHGDTTFTYQYFFGDTTLYYISDSSITYYPPLRLSGCAVCDKSIPEGSMIISGSKLYYDFIYVNSELVFELFPADTLRNDTGRLYLRAGADPPSFFRQISLSETLQIDQIEYTGLLKVRCDQLHFSDDVSNQQYEGSYWEFYFSKESGLLAIIQKPFATSTEQRYYFEPTGSPLPLLLEK